MIAERQATAKPVAIRPPAAGFQRVLRRKCACGGSGGECEGCKQSAMTLQRRAGNGVTPHSVPPIVHKALRAPGQSLDPTTRAYMEPRLGHDFGGVRVHTDHVGAASADAINARAYTVGNDVVFGAGQYAPSTEAGMRLLAHELAHVAQQQAGGAAGLAAAPIEIGAVNDPAEREAQDAADRIARDAQPPRSVSAQRAPCLRRQPADDQPKKEPKPWIPLPHPFDRLDPKVTVPGLGSGSLEDLHKLLDPPSSGGKPQKDCNAPGWELQKTGLCCPKYSVDPGQCCPPYRWSPIGRCCAEDERSDGISCVKWNVGVPKLPSQPPVPGGDSSDPHVPYKGPGLSLSLPPLIVSFPIYFLLNRPASVVKDQSGLRSSFAVGGAEMFDQIVAWLKRDPSSAVQLSGKASSEGPPAHNRELGQWRAQSVANALMQNGISGARIMDPPNLPADCPSFGDGLHNCGDVGAAKPVDEKDRQVLARLFIVPDQPAKRRF